NSLIPVVMITGHGTIETAVKATKFGAFDFIEKPLSIDKVIVAINNALNFRKLEEENKYLRKKTIEKNSIDGNSQAVASLKEQIAVAAPTEAWILITGENGTGKELVARTIHQLSHRSEEPLIDVNCAAIPKELIESELFGHEKGAFSGAATKSIGKFEFAGTGTVFLDEIGDMSLQTQAKILRVLQELKFQRVGGTRTLEMKARLIVASNKDLEKEIERGNFREDLYFRLNVIPIEVPPLRGRYEDIPILVETFMAKFVGQHQREPKTLTQEAMELLTAYSWPGNIRELKNLLERLAIMVQSNTIDVSDIPSPYNPALVEKQKMKEMNFFSFSKLKDAKKAFEDEFIRRKLLSNKSNVAKTAEKIGVDRSLLHKKLKKMV
ncbi:MAG: sigma-54-dependent Fis family transcriptional regulator, partial [Deltaproteobacteria bacterium]|nr:sigma-54-dependent Fis family transcriptional regulator [Deltaproteobacteria bacterium]